MRKTRHEQPNVPNERADRARALMPEKRAWEAQWATGRAKWYSVAAKSAVLGKGRLSLHKGLSKAESAILVQARTDNIGLARFLYTRKVPGIETAQCSCGQGEETARHVALFCSKEEARRPYLRTKGRVDYKVLTGTREGAKLFSA